MRFETEAKALYSRVQAQAKGSVNNRKLHGVEPYLPLLRNAVSMNKLGNRIDLGILEIPTEKIVGVAWNTDRALYTHDFLPLPDPDSEYAQTWCKLYQYYLNDIELDSLVDCYEYLGYFFVRDGKKRVSVLKCHGAPTVRAKVIRILPAEIDDPQMQSYKEFTCYFDMTKLYQIQFTRPGSFSKLQTALGYEPDHVWNESDRYSFMFHWHAIERAFHDAFDGSMNITTADALLVLLEEIPFAQIRQMQIWELKRLFQMNWKKLYALSEADSIFCYNIEVGKVS